MLQILKADLVVKKYNLRDLAQTAPLLGVTKPKKTKNGNEISKTMAKSWIKSKWFLNFCLIG